MAKMIIVVFTQVSSAFREATLITMECQARKWPRFSQVKQQPQEWQTQPRFFPLQVLVDHSHLGHISYITLVMHPFGLSMHVCIRSQHREIQLKTQLRQILTQASHRRQQSLLKSLLLLILT